MQKLIIFADLYLLLFQISKMSSKILLYLLQSQLLMTSSRWQQVLDATVPVMSVLQVVYPTYDFILDIFIHVFVVC